MNARIAIVTSLLIACGGKSPAPAASPPAPPEATEPAAAPSEPAPPSDVEATIAASALAEQYEVGKTIYVDKKCASCHEDNGAGNPKNPAVIGEGALPAKAPAKAKLRKGIVFTTAKDVLDFVKAKMPLKQPATLTDDEASAVVAWMLDSNKIALTKKLDVANAASVKLRAE